MTRAARLWSAMGIVLAIYLGSNLASARLLELAFGLSCAPGLFSVACGFQPDGGFDPLAYAALASAVLATFVLFRLRWYDRVAYPFVATLAMILLFSLGYDVAVGAPIIHAGKIVNDTVNVLGFVIFASFLLTLFILRHGRIPLLRVAAAAATSYFVKLAAIASFIAIQPQVSGATELFLLYVAYAFGAFTVHIMTVSSLIAATQLVTARGRA